MLSNESYCEQREYRLAMVLPHSMRVLALSGPHKVQLPRVRILPSARIAAEITKVIQVHWGIKAIVLEILWLADITSACAVVEIFSAGKGSDLPRGLVMVDYDDLPQTELSFEERPIVLAIVSGDPGSRGPFSRIGWLLEVMDWIRSAVPGTPEFSDFHQINAGHGFALVRFSTVQGRAYWLKATGEPNRHEFDITIKLSQICSGYLPTVVAVRQDWNTWVVEDAGDCLEEPTPFSYLELAVSNLEGIHRRTVHRTAELKRSGFPHRSVSTLNENLPELFEYLQDVMVLQRSTRVPRLGPFRLRQLGAILRNACDRMQDLDVPDSVVHNDLNRGNILFDKGRCVFTDWCETSIGNPFFDFERLALSLPSLGRHRDRDLMTLRTIYRRCWSDELSSSEIDEAFLLAPLLAAASYLYGRGDWLRSMRRSDPYVQSHARAVARFIDRAAYDLGTRRILCH
jgi:Phosphotransferase enzyme family